MGCEKFGGFSVPLRTIWGQNTSFSPHWLHISIVSLSLRWPWTSLCSFLPRGLRPVSALFSPAPSLLLNTAADNCCSFAGGTLTAATAMAPPCATRVCPLRCWAPLLFPYCDPTAGALQSCCSFAAETLACCRCNLLACGLAVAWLCSSVSLSCRFCCCFLTHMARPLPLAGLPPARGLTAAQCCSHQSAPANCVAAVILNSWYVFSFSFVSLTMV